MKLITFKCSSKDGPLQQWEASLEIICMGKPCEAMVTAGGDYFHVIAGSYAYGKYICIPNHNVGAEIASFTDTFWNCQKLEKCTSLNAMEACTVAFALKELGKIALEHTK